MNSQLNSIRTDINLAEVPPLNHRRMVAFVNCYLMRMTDMLNDFALRANDVILATEEQLRVTDKRLAILEKKLSGISLSAASPVVPSPSEVETPSYVRPDPPSLVEKEKDATNREETIVVKVDPPAAPVEVAVPRPQSLSTLTVKDDPAYAKYFKMLKLGVLEPAVKLKMQSEGVDPSILDNPTAPSPNAAKVPDQSIMESDNSSEFGDESDSSFSD